MNEQTFATYIVLMRETFVNKQNYTQSFNLSNGKMISNIQALFAMISNNKLACPILLK